MDESKEKPLLAEPVITPIGERLRGVRIIEDKKIVVIGAGVGAEMLSHAKIKMLLESQAEHVIIVSDNAENNSIEELNRFFKDGDITVVPYDMMDLKTIRELKTNEILEFKALDKFENEPSHKFESFNKFQKNYEPRGIKTSGKNRKQNNAKLAKRKPKSKKTHRRK